MVYPQGNTIPTRFIEATTTETNYFGNPTFPHTKEFAGKKEQFDELCYKLRAYMSMLNPGYAQICRRVDENPHTMIRDEDIHDFQQRIEDGGIATPQFLLQIHHEHIWHHYYSTS